MRDYEVVYIFKSALSTEDIEAGVEKHHQNILAGAGAEITAVEYWGKRELAYPIDDHRSGTYVVAQFTAPADVLSEYERRLKLDEDLLRHLVVLSEGELPTPPSMREEEQRGDRPKSDDDDDDDDAAADDDDDAAADDDDDDDDDDADDDADDADDDDDDADDDADDADDDDDSADAAADADADADDGDDDDDDDDDAAEEEK